MTKKLKKVSAPKPGRWLLLLALILSSIGLLFVFEASVSESFDIVGHPYLFVKNQATWFTLGLLGMGVCYRIPHIFWKKLAPVLFFGSLILLILVFVPGIGVNYNGAHRWIDLGFTVFQPVELVKFSLVVFFARWMSQHQRILPFLFLTGIPVSLVMLQPDLGSALVLIGIAFSIFFVAGGNLKALGLVGAAGVILLSVIIMNSPYKMERVKTFMDPSHDPLNSGFQIRQITLALGNGGLLGQGIGQSRQKFAYIPEATTDSIFAIVAEEIGFLGSLALIGIFASFLGVAYRCTTSSEEGSFSHLLTFGLTAWVTVQLLLNLSAVLVLVPLTGVPLPFISYGGTSLLMLLCASGIIASNQRTT